MSRSGDALGWSAIGRSPRLPARPDGPLRDEVAEPAREPCRAHRSAWPVDRQGAPATTAEDYRARHGFERKPDLWEQEGSAYNGHFGCTCYHPQFVFNQLGDVERCALRFGNVHSADGWRPVLEPVVARYRGTVKRLYFRGNAAFANPEIYGSSKPSASAIRSGCRPTESCRTRSDTCSSTRSGDRRTRCGATSPASDIRRRVWRKPRRVVAKVV